MKKFFSAFWHVLRSNLLLKIMSLLFAVILWSYVLSAVDPTRERWVSDISVSYQNADELKANGFAISESLSEILETADVLVGVFQSEIQYLSEENVKAYIDLSTINSTGWQTIEITATTEYGQKVRVSPSEVELYIDEYVTRTVPVNVEVTGSAADGYYAGTPEITPEVVSISGAKTDVLKVASALCTVDIDGLTEGFNKSIPVTLLDSDGAAVDESLFSGELPSVIVKLSVLAQKEVPVDVEGSIIGQDSLAAGYEITSMTCDPASVTIVGEKDVIDTITSVPLVAYSISGASADVTALLDYDLPEGVSVLESDKAQVEILIRETTAEHTYSNIPIDQKNLSSGLVATISQDVVDVTVIAGVSAVSALDKSDIVSYVDLEGLEPGTYSLDVLFEIPDGYIADNFTPSVKTVTVTIKKK